MKQELNKMNIDSLSVAFGAVIVRCADADKLRANIRRLSPVVKKLTSLDWAAGSGVL